jgi:hypothetical protein
VDLGGNLESEEASFLALGLNFSGEEGDNLLFLEKGFIIRS